MAVAKGEIGIYGVLVNDTPDAVIAYASQVKDTATGKTQQAINAEVKTALAGLSADTILSIGTDEIDELITI